MSSAVAGGPGEGFSDAISVEFANPRDGLFGFAQIELFPNDGRARATGLLFDHEEAIAAAAEEARLEVPAEWGNVTVGDVAIEDDGERVRARLGSRGTSFDVEFEPGLVAEFDRGSGAGLVAGAERQVVSGGVTGQVRRNGSSVSLECLGQASRTSGAIEWGHLAALRALGAVFDDGSLLAIWAVRPARAAGHGEDALSAALVEERGALPLERTLLSTHYDEERRHRHANVEMVPIVPEGEEEKPPLRAAGAIVCGTSLSLGGLQLDTAFFRWSMEGKPGLGRYDIVRPV